MADLAMVVIIMIFMAMVVEFSLIMGAEMGQRMDRAPALPILQLEIQGQRILDPRPTPPRQPLIKTGLIRGLV